MHLKKWLLQFLLMIVLAVLVASNGRSKRYCELPLCKSTNLACNNKGNLTAVACHRSAKVLKMRKYQAPLADLFNSLRNRVAGGNYRNLQIAARMGKMIWSPELEWFAQLDVSRCHLNARPCMTSPFFYYVGRLVDQHMYLEQDVTRGHFAMMRQSVEKWASDVRGISRTETLQLPYRMDKPKKYRSTLLINERNSQFGCSALVYLYDGFNYLLFSCAFATDNLVHKPIYKWSSQPGSLCHQRDKIYTNLCSSGQNYQNNEPIKGFETYANPSEKEMI